MSKASAEGAASRSACAYRLIIAQIVSVAGDRMFLIAATWWVAESSPPDRQVVNLGWFLALTSFSVVLTAPFWGRLIDRMDRRRCMLIADLGRLLIATGLGFLIHGDHLTLAWLFALCVPLFALEPLFDTAVSASIAQLSGGSRERNRLVALESAIPWFGAACGAAGAALSLAASVETSIWADALTFCCSFILVYGIPGICPPTDSIATASRGVFDILRSHHQAGVLLVLFALMNLSLAPLFIYLPLIVQQILHGEAVQLALLELSFASGSLLTLAYLAWRPPHRAELSAVSMFLLAGSTSVLLVLLQVSGHFLMMAGTLLAWGVSIAIMNYMVFAYFQRCIPDDEKGRFFGIATALFGLGFPLGYFVFGLVAPLFTLSEIVFGNALLCLILSTGFLGITEGIQHFEK